MRRTDDQNTRVVAFDSLVEMIDETAKACPAGEGPRDYEAGFYGRNVGNDWSSVRKALGTVWEKGMRLTNEMLNELAKEEIPTPTNRSRRRRWNEDQGDIDIERVMQGDPVCFVETRREAVHGPNTITIIVNVGGLGNVSADDLLWRSTATIAAVTKLEDAGYQCEIIGYSFVNYGYDSGMTQALTIFPVKEAGESLDMMRVVNGLSSWMFRAVAMKSRWIMGRVRSGYGKTIYHTNQFVRDQLGLDSTTRAMFVDASFSKEEALETVRNIIQSVATEGERV
jgi:hypothetical protein